MKVDKLMTHGRFPSLITALFQVFQVYDTTVVISTLLFISITVVISTLLFISIYDTTVVISTLLFISFYDTTVVISTLLFISITCFNIIIYFIVDGYCAT